MKNFFLLFFTKKIFILIFFNIFFCKLAYSGNEYMLVNDFKAYNIKKIAILPISNHTFEEDVSSYMYDSIYKYLSKKGYYISSKDKVNSVLSDLGIQNANQYLEISSQKFGDMLSADAYFFGSIDQSADITNGVYDAVVVSCSLHLIHCETGEILWSADQWRVAHRSFNLDPINMLLSRVEHKNSSRKKRVEYLVYKMMEYFPQGNVHVTDGDLFESAITIESTTE
jgi:hypothetical protein